MCVRQRGEEGGQVKNRFSGICKGILVENREIMGVACLFGKLYDARGWCGNQTQGG